MYYRRTIERALQRQLQRGKSVLLLGPRQAGKTTLVGSLKPDLMVSLVAPRDRQRYERDPSILSGEVLALADRKGRTPLVTVDEVQKVPGIMDVGQDLIDRHAAQFIFTGSSARKLRRGRQINLLPGRVVVLRLDPLLIEEDRQATLENVLLFGALPGIRQVHEEADREIDLRAYVETYLEEEVRQEALVRKVGLFGRFLELASLDSGRIANYSKISRDVGVSPLTVQAYYEILCDCLVTERVEPITRSVSRKKLTKASRYLLFDLGVRRLAAREGPRPHPSRTGELFEQFVGLELIRWCRLHTPRTQVKFWRDPDGPEVDWVLDDGGSYLPVEVKLTERPTERNVKHLDVFMKEYRSTKGLLVCTEPRAIRLAKGIVAIPWPELPAALESRL